MLAAAVRVVSTVGAAPLTVTVSATPETVICELNTTAWPTVRTMSSCTSVAKPDSVSVTV